MDDNDFAALLKFASLHGLALFAIEAGRKAPTGIVNFFAKDWSRDPEQWRRWRAENPGCNFGVVCGPSGLIIVDVDIKAGVAQWIPSLASECRRRTATVDGAHAERRLPHLF